MQLLDANTPPPQRKISALVIAAHPALERSRANKALLKAAKTVAGVTINDLYETAPDFVIDVVAEQKALKAHEVIVLQFPVSWYAPPSLLKEWIDLVWLHGFAHGAKGVHLKGKTLLVAATAGEPKSAYCEGGANGATLEEFLRPLKRSASYCGMTWARPFLLYGSVNAPPAKLESEAERYRTRLLTLTGQAPPKELK